MSPRKNLSGSTYSGPLEQSFVDRGDVSGSVSLDVGVGNLQQLRLVGNTTLAFTGITSGKGCSLTILLVQDGTGSRTITWPGSVKWQDGTAPTLSTAANAVDILTLITTDGGTTWYGFLVGKGMA